MFRVCLWCVADDIEVVFYETDPNTGKRSWEAQGIFSPTDVHRQVQFIRNNSNLTHISLGPEILLKNTI